MEQVRAVAGAVRLGIVLHPTAGVCAMLWLRNVLVLNCVRWMMRLPASLICSATGCLVWPAGCHVCWCSRSLRQLITLCTTFLRELEEVMESPDVVSESIALAPVLSQLSTLLSIFSSYQKAAQGLLCAPSAGYDTGDVMS